MTEQKPTVGFIGIGVMGRSMAGHLLDAGYSVHVYNRTQAKAQIWWIVGPNGSPLRAAAAADVIITIVGFPVDVESVYLGEDGVLAQARSGSLAIDMTTSCPTWPHASPRRPRPRDRSFGCSRFRGDIGSRSSPVHHGGRQRIWV